MYTVLLVLTRGWHLSRQWCIGRESQIFPTPSHLAHSFGVTPFEFIEKLYGSWNQCLPGSRWWRFGDPSLHCFWLIHLYDRRTDGQTELWWLRRATAVAAAVRKKLENARKAAKPEDTDRCQSDLDLSVRPSNLSVKWLSWDSMCGESMFSSNSRPWSMRALTRGGISVSSL